MATKEKLQEHVKTARSKVDEARKKAGNDKYNSDLRAARKKLKRLARKVGKIAYMEKKKEEKSKKKKGGES